MTLLITPGEWTVGSSADFPLPAVDCVKPDGQPVEICTCWNTSPTERSDVRNEENEANAKAISAVPQMIMALITAREFISAERNSFADCNINHDGTFEQCDQEILRDYDQALLQINGALQKAGVA